MNAVCLKRVACTINNATVQVGSRSGAEILDRLACKGITIPIYYKLKYANNPHT
jgi:hypothetical protein